MSGVSLSIVIGYLLGSCPFGYWAGRLRGVDLRKQGSGNTGGTNAVRVLGPAVGVPVIMLDVLKGTAAVLIAAQLGGVGSRGAGWSGGRGRAHVPGVPAVPRRQGRGHRSGRDAGAGARHLG